VELLEMYSPLPNMTFDVDYMIEYLEVMLFGLQDD
jgi:hypothetical protein